MANYTEHYQLHQWEGSDAFLRTDFNEDFKKIDTALGMMVNDRVIQGKYVGDGTDSRTIQLPWEPVVVLLLGHLQVYDLMAFLTQESCRFISHNGCSSDLTYMPRLTGSTLQVQDADWSNKSGLTVHYVAIR